MAKDVHAPGTAANSSKSKPVLSLLVATIGSDPNEQEHPLLHVHQIMTDGIDLVAVARDFISKCDSRLTTLDSTCISKCSVGLSIDMELFF